MVMQYILMLIKPFLFIFFNRQTSYTIDIPAYWVAVLYEDTTLPYANAWYRPLWYMSGLSDSKIQPITVILGITTTVINKRNKI
jgi:hypothetical protein